MRKLSTCRGTARKANNRLHGIKKSAVWEKKDNLDLLSSWWYWLVVLFPIIGLIAYI